MGENYYKNDTLFIKEDFKYPLLQSEKDAINLKYQLEKKRRYKTNDQIGKVSLYIGDKKVKDQDIYIKKGKKSLTFFEKIKSWFNDK